MYHGELICNAGQVLRLSAEQSPESMPVDFHVVETFEWRGTYQRVLEVTNLTPADHPITRINAMMDTLLLSGHIVPVQLQ